MGPQPDLGPMTEPQPQVCSLPGAQGAARYAGFDGLFGQVERTVAVDHLTNGDIGTDDPDPLPPSEVAVSPVRDAPRRWCRSCAMVGSHAAPPDGCHPPQQVRHHTGPTGARAVPWLSAARPSAQRIACSMHMESTCRQLHPRPEAHALRPARVRPRRRWWARCDRASAASTSWPGRATP